MEIYCRRWADVGSAATILATGPGQVHAQSIMIAGPRQAPTTGFFIVRN